jgi:endonuclease III
VAEQKTRARPEQVNVRLTAEENDVLAALCFLEECSASEVLRPVIEAFLSQQTKDPQVGAVLRALAERRGIKSGDVTALRKARRPSAVVGSSETNSPE